MKRRRFSLRTDDKTEPQLRPERLCSLCNRKSTTSSSRSRHIWHCHRETGKVSHRGLKSGEGAHEPYISTSRAGCPPIHLHAYLSAATPAALCNANTECHSAAGAPQPWSKGMWHCIHLWEQTNDIFNLQRSVSESVRLTAVGTHGSFPDFLKTSLS